MLEKVDLRRSLDKASYKAQMPRLRDRLYAAQKLSWDAGLAVMIVFEGWSAAGKGTTIQQLTAPLDPRGFKLHAIQPPRTHEKAYPWLWRFWTKLPARGEWAIYDGSWYRRVLVERVEKQIPEEEWRRAYRDIVDFERAQADDGTLIVKFFLHISRQEQKKRFKKLEKDPVTAWRVTEEDWEQQRRYERYLLAVEEMLERTETEWGPWTIVEATDKRHCRVKVFETLLAQVVDRLTERGQLNDQQLAYLTHYHSTSDAPAVFWPAVRQMGGDDEDDDDGPGDADDLLVDDTVLDDITVDGQG